MATHQGCAKLPHHKVHSSLAFMARSVRPLVCQQVGGVAALIIGCQRQRLPCWTACLGAIYKNNHMHTRACSGRGLVCMGQWVPVRGDRMLMDALRCRVLADALPNALPCSVLQALWLAAVPFILPPVGECPAFATHASLESLKGLMGVRLQALQMFVFHRQVSSCACVCCVCDLHACFLLCCEFDPHTLLQLLCRAAFHSMRVVVLRCCLSFGCSISMSGRTAAVLYCVSLHTVLPWPTWPQSLGERHTQSVPAMQAAR